MSAERDVVVAAGGSLDRDPVPTVTGTRQLFGGQGAPDTLFEVAVVHHTQCGTGFLADRDPLPATKERDQGDHPRACGPGEEPAQARQPGRPPACLRRGCV
jgi:hypothetical protein